ncbi:MAG: hypothetical protein R3270_02770 [Gammaproteobacteria bacterium]|nr:hypothetical protein [Gammaproteobacteria bacterium]
MENKTMSWRRMALASAAFGLALAASLALLFFALPLPSLNLLQLDYEPSWWWTPAVLPVSVLLGIAAFLLLRQWQSKRLAHDLLAAVVLPALVAALASFLLLQSARSHSSLLAQASPQLSINTIQRLEKGLLQERMDAGQFVEACRYYRRWRYLETGDQFTCEFPEGVPLQFPPQESLPEFGRRHAEVEEGLEMQAQAMRAAVGLPWLAWLGGLLVGWLRRRD